MTNQKIPIGFKELVDHYNKYYIESNMDFTPLFNSDKYRAFYIEQASLYKDLDSVKSVEFIATHRKKVYFIECKERNYETSKDSITIMDDLKLNPQDLYTKLHHSIDLFVARQLKIGKHTNHTFEKELGNVSVLDTDFSKVNIFFYVVAKGESFDKETCVKIRAALNKKLVPLLKIWNIHIEVITEEKARKNKMIV